MNKTDKRTGVSWLISNCTTLVHLDKKKKKQTEQPVAMNTSKKFNAHKPMLAEEDIKISGGFITC